MLFATEHINAVSAKPADTLGTCVALVENAGSFTPGTVDFYLGSKCRGCTGVRRKAGRGKVEISP